MQGSHLYTSTSVNARKLCVFLTALAALAGVGLQLYITINGIQPNRTLPGALVQFFSYFTIISNLLVGLSAGSLLFNPANQSPRIFNSPSKLTAVALYITVTGLVYATALRSLWTPPTFIEKLANELLHTFSPILYMLVWVVFINKSQVKWTDLSKWIIFPVIYIVYIAIRGAVSGIYPYPFIDVVKIGYPKAIITTGILLIVMLLLGSFFIAAAKFIAKRQR